MKTAIPFQGFYESVHDMAIDEAVERIFDPEGKGMPIIPNDFYLKMKWPRVDYAREFTKWFNDEIKQYINVELTFESLDSPREYNFTTDRIFCDISENDVKKLYANTKTGILESLVKESFTSYDGFRSFYNNDIYTTGEVKTNWNIPVTQWDHNQVETLLIACLLSIIKDSKFCRDHDSELKENLAFDEYGFVERLSETGKLENMLFKNAPEECVKMMNGKQTQ